MSNGILNFGSEFSNKRLGYLNQRYAEQMGVVFPSQLEQKSIVDGSTDRANVSLVVPLRVASILLQ